MLSRLTKPFLYLFYILAQNPFPTADFSSKNKFKKILFTLPVLVLICISVYFTLYSLRNDQYVTEYNKAREIFHVLLIVSSFVGNLTTAYQCIFLRQTWTELLKSFSELETEFQKMLPIAHGELIKFRKMFIIKCVIMFALYVFTVSVRIVLYTIFDKHLSYMFVLGFFNDLNALQVLFFVDLSKFFLKIISRGFRDNVDSTKCFDEKFIKSKFLISTKKLYSRIWKTVQQINEYFGVFLLAYIVAQFLNISYDIYWILFNKFTAGIWMSLGLKFVYFSLFSIAYI